MSEATVGFWVMATCCWATSAALVVLAFCKWKEK